MIETPGGESMVRFEEHLSKTSMTDDEKKDIRFFIEYLSGKHLNLLSSKIVLLTGEAGMGKTYLARKLVFCLDIPVFYVGQEDLEGEGITRYGSIEEAHDSIDFRKSCLIFFDDMNYLAEEEFGEVTNDHKRMMLSLFSRIKSSPARIGFLGTMNSIYFDSQLVDRTDIMIKIEAPDKMSKISYLESKYYGFLKKAMIKSIASKSIGHNFRDLDEIIRMSYRYGKGRFTNEGIAKALKSHMPANFRYYDILNDIDLDFKSIVGREEIKDRLSEIKSLFKNRNKISKYGLKRSNLLVFYGPPGTGKTYMAKAFAGEIGFPLLNMNAQELYRRSPITAFEKMVDFASRFKNTVILIDEADKLLGRPMFDEEGPIQGHLNSVFDGINSINDSIVIFALNKLENFGEAFKDRFTAIEFCYPSDEERNAFLLSRIKKHSMIFDGSINLSSVSSLTRSMSFRDMEKVWGSIVTRYLRTQKQVTLSDIEEMLRPKKQHDMMFG